MDDKELFKSVELLIAYFLPGVLFSFLIIPDLINIGLFQEKKFLSTLGDYTIIGIIMGPLLRGCDTLLYKYILKYNILNHYLWIKYKTLRKNWSVVLSGGNKYTLISKLNKDVRTIVFTLESLSDGYMWTSFVLFLKSLILLINFHFYLGLIILSLSWIILYEGIDYGMEYVELLSMSNKR